MTNLPDLNSNQRFDTGDEALWRKHVTRGQMKRLESGQTITLNHDQLAELRRYAPEWVTIVSVKDGQFAHVSITDMRKKR